MFPAHRVWLRRSCGVMGVVLAWSWVGPALGQADDGVRHAVDVSSSSGQADAKPSAPSPLQAKPPARPSCYGWTHPCPLAYGYPYVHNGRYVWPVGGGYHYYPYGSLGYHGGFTRAYRGSWYDYYERVRNRKRFTKRTRDRSERLAESHRTKMSQGLQAFAAGQYEVARSAFVLAAGMDISDPASRIHAAHACFALGRYSQAVQWLREAFGLEPRIRELPYDLRNDYGRQEDFDAHLAALKGCLEAFPKEVDPPILLGYVHYFTGNRTEAYEALCKAKPRLPKGKQDDLLALLLEASEPSRFVARKPEG